MTRIESSASEQSDVSARRGVELVFFQGCPHAGAARENVRAALSGAERPLQWREWDLDDPATPRWAGEYPSPTVLVEGADVTGLGPQPGGSGWSCRARGAPTVAEIAAALSGAGR